MKLQFLARANRLSWILSIGLLAPLAGQAQPDYEFRKEHDRDGIGKFYLGREIAHVMGHQGADWLERPERLEEERPDLLMEKLPFKEGDKVADIGAGTGYIARRLAEMVGEEGLVYAVDIQPEMIALLKERLEEEEIENVKPVLGKIEDPQLPKGELDGVIMVDVYHELSHPYEVLEAIVASLKPGGQVVFVEYKGEDPAVPIKRLHKMTEAQVKKEASVFPLEWVSTDSSLPRQHVILFRKMDRPTNQKEAR